MTEAEGSNDLDLHRFVRVVWSHAWVVVLATVAVVGPAIAWSNAQTPRYRASAEMLLEPKGSETLFNQAGSGGGNEPTRAIATEAKRLRSRAVTEAAVKKLGYRADVETSASGLDNVIKVTAVSTDPRRAAEIANTFVATYIQHRRTTTLQDIFETQTEIQKKIDEKQLAIAALDEGIAELPPVQRPAASQARALERTSLVNQQSLFRAQLDQLQVNASLNSGGAEMLTPAQAPDVPFEPKVAQTAALAVVAGLMLGVGLAFLLDFLDDSIKGEEELERAAFGLPLLGSVPTVRGWKKEKAAQLVSIAAPSSSAAEGYRGLRASVQFLGVDRPLRVLQVTSPAVAEGKTTTTANLAVALARSGQRVVVMCCDLRRPRLHEFFGLSNDVGLTSVLIGDASLDDALQPISGEDIDLELLASGPRPPNPSELLSGQHFADVLASLQARADIVVVDSPPVLPVSDAAVLSANAGATVLVVRPGRTSRKAVRRALASLRRVNAPVVGIVLNGVGKVGSYAYGEYHEQPVKETGPHPGRPPRQRAPQTRLAEERPSPRERIPSAVDRPEPDRPVPARLVTDRPAEHEGSAPADRPPERRSEPVGAQQPERPAPEPQLQPSEPARPPAWVGLRVPTPDQQLHHIHPERPRPVQPVPVPRQSEPAEKASEVVDDAELRVHARTSALPVERRSRPSVHKSRSWRWSWRASSPSTRPPEAFKQDRG